MFELAYPEDGVIINHDARQFIGGFVRSPLHPVNQSVWVGKRHYGYCLLGARYLPFEEPAGRRRKRSEWT